MVYDRDLVTWHIQLIETVCSRSFEIHLPPKTVDYEMFPQFLGQSGQIDAVAKEVLSWIKSCLSDVPNTADGAWVLCRKEEADELQAVIASA